MLLRLPGLLHAGVWRDEAFIYTAVDAASFQQAFHRFLEIASSPPLYLIAIFAWTKLAGFSEVALKLPSFICSVLTILAVFWLGRIADRTRTGLLAAFLYAVSPLGIQFSSYVRPYPFLGLLFTLLATLFLQMQVAATWRRIAATAFLTFAAVFTHYFGVLAALIFILFSLVAAGVKRGAAPAAAFAVGALPFIFWLPALFNQMHGPASSPFATSLIRTISSGSWETWSTPAPAMTKALYFAWALIRSSPTGTWEAFVPFVIVTATVLLFGPRRPSVALLAGIFLAAVALENALNFREMRYVYPFYALFAVFTAWIFLIAAESIWNAVGMRARSLVVAGSFLLALAVFGYGTATALENARAHSGIRTLVQAEAGGTGRFYVIAPDYLSATFFYYTRGEVMPFIGFARLRDSQYLVPAGYAARWNDPLAVQRAECVIAAMAARYSSFSFVADPGAHNQWHIPYGKTWELLAFVKAHYPLESRRSFAGSEESVSEFRFRGRAFVRQRECAAQQQ